MPKKNLVCPYCIRIYVDIIGKTKQNLDSGTAVKQLLVNYATCSLLIVGNSPQCLPALNHFIYIVETYVSHSCVDFDVKSYVCFFDICLLYEFQREVEKY